MTVSIFEVCRSPEYKKETEAVFLSKLFKYKKIPYKLYSNDPVWPDYLNIDKEFIEQRLLEDNPKVVHLAMHGGENGLILGWSREKIPTIKLTGFEIEHMPGWKGRIVVSGACESGNSY